MRTLDPAALEALRAHVVAEAAEPAALWLYAQGDALVTVRNPPELARMFFDLSIDARGAERPELCEELLRRAQRIADEAGDAETAAAASNHLSILAESCGRLDAMSEWINDAIQRRTSPPLAGSGFTNAVHLAGVDCNCGNLLRQLGDLDEARSWYQQSIRALEPLAFTPLAAQFLRNAAESLEGLDELPPPPFRVFHRAPIPTPGGEVDPDALRARIDTLSAELLEEPEAHDRRLEKARALLDLGAALDGLVSTRRALAEADRGVRFYLTPATREARACALRARECCERLRLRAPALAGVGEAMGQALAQLGPTAP